MPIQPLYLAVHNEAGQLEAYWHLRQFSRGWLMTSRLPGCECIVRRHQKPSAVVAMFYELYTSYLVRLVEEMSRLLAELPTVETYRDGFRPGWLAKRRRALISRRAELICGGRRKYAEAITMLRARGWPTPPPIPLNFGGFDSPSAAVTAYVEYRATTTPTDVSKAFTHQLGNIN